MNQNNVSAEPISDNLKILESTIVNLSTNKGLKLSFENLEVDLIEIIDSRYHEWKQLRSLDWINQE